MRDLTQNPIGIYEKAMPNNYSWADKIKVAKLAGFDFIEISIDESDERLSRLNWSRAQRRAIKQQLEAHQMEIRSMCLSGHRRFPFGSADETKRQKAYQIIDQAIIFALDLGIRNIQLAGYDVYYEQSTEQSIDRFISGLRYAAQCAERANVMLSIEIMDTSLCGTLSRAKAFLNKAPSPYLKLYPDLGNLSRWTETPNQEIVDHFQDIVAVHLKDTQPNVFKCVPFGEGTVDFKSLFKTLSKLNYHGPFLIEMWAKNEREILTDDCVKSLVLAKEWLWNRMVLC